MNSLHYLRKMESVTLDLFFISRQMPSVLLSYLTCFDRYLDADIGHDTVFILVWEFIGRYFVWNPQKEMELNCQTNSIIHSGQPKRMLTSSIRITVLITFVFRLIMFLWGHCVLIIESTNRRGKSNYFLDWGQTLAFNPEVYPSSNTRNKQRQDPVLYFKAVTLTNDGVLPQ